MKKKFLALVMTLSMVLSLVPMTALATGDGEPTGQPITTTEGQTENAATNGDDQKGDSTTGGAATPEGGENTPIAVPADKLIFDKTKGEIKGIDATWLAENKDKPLSVTILAEIDGTPVTSIGIQAFQHYKKAFCSLSTHHQNL